MSVYAQNYSTEIKNYLERIEVLSPKEIKFSQIKRSLEKFNNVTVIESKGDYFIKGDTISLWPVGYPHPIRLEFFGEDLENMYEYDEVYNRKMHNLNLLILTEYKIEDRGDLESINISGYRGDSAEEINKMIFVSSASGIPQDNNEIITTDFQYPQLFYSRFDLLEKEIKRLETNGFTVFIQTNNKRDIKNELKKYYKTILRIKTKEGIFKNIEENLEKVKLNAGFTSNELKLAVFTDRELFGAIYLNKPERQKKVSNNIRRLLKQFEGEIQIDDCIVHEDYGVGVYAGLKQELVDGEMREYLLLRYADDDELYVPIHHIEKITKYIGNEGISPRITRLGRASWENIKTKVKRSAELIAKELAEHYAKREVSKAKPLKDSDSKNYKDFVEEFKYIETDDQLRSINEVLEDLTTDEPMDRLLVGDVGFGKTEVFMRAAFKIVEGGGQVAILSPTTVLTAQHYSVFTERFKNFPITVKYLSRFNSPVENKKIIDELNESKVDIVIGTHRLLSSDVKFKNLQLLVVDEEQRFGVKQKEKIKQLNYGVHLLSVSATPIPRTLSMALSSIQKISIITQPPKERKAVKTEIINENWNKIAQIIHKEVERGGQVYFLHNVVQTIDMIQKKLERLLPGIKFITAHGQMNPDKLDKIMTEFYEKKHDCLISTTIIENGLDLPNVNTIIIDNAHKFGLSQLYQLRGRVGRSDKDAYCFLIAPRKVDSLVEEKPDKKPEKKFVTRLETLVENQDLGAGFRIASRDLEIRGAGNLLGEQQSGHISTIGYALYVQILAEEVEKLRSLFH